VPREKALLGDTWRGLRRSGAWVAWGATAMSAIPIASAVYQAWMNGGMWRMTCVLSGVLALVVACVIGQRLRQARERRIQWQLTGICWLLVTGSMAIVFLM
jgi:hypothetical protein